MCNGVSEIAAWGDNEAVLQACTNKKRMPHVCHGRTKAHDEHVVHFLKVTRKEAYFLFLGSEDYDIWKLDNDILEGEAIGSTKFQDFFYCHCHRKMAFDECACERCCQMDWYLQALHDLGARCHIKTGKVCVYVSVIYVMKVTVKK